MLLRWIWIVIADQRIFQTLEWKSPWCRVRSITNIFALFHKWSTIYVDYIMLLLRCIRIVIAAQRIFQIFQTFERKSPWCRARSITYIFSLFHKWPIPYVDYIMLLLRWIWIVITAQRIFQAPLTKSMIFVKLYREWKQP